ncbi:MAG TPA: hypothetical protein VFW71_07470 [Actinomycetota bacterium]|nr:hypothetical protein [Actinomycetota bacterium]
MDQQHARKDRSRAGIAAERSWLGLQAITRAVIAGGTIVVLMGAFLVFARAHSGVSAVRDVAAGAGGSILAPPAITETASPPAASGAPQAAAPSAAPAPAAPAPAAPPAPAPPDRLVAYRGLGAWVSLYDYALGNASLNPAQAVDAMVSRGVQTLYLQTSRWNLSPAVYDTKDVGAFIDDAHAHGIQVVGWYLPGFAPVSADLANALTDLHFTSPKGGHFDGLSLDIEDFSGVDNNLGAFDSGIVSLSRQLRAAVGPDQALGAIVPDAVNDRRAPATWAGFPWPEIGRDYDVVLPMGYWTVTKPSSKCGIQYDAGGYTKDIYQTTTALMGATKAMVIVGGIGDCDTLAEVQAYAQAAKSIGLLGASIYSFQTVQRNAQAGPMWEALQADRR